MPYWELAATSPEERFPDAFSYLPNIVDDDLRTLKRTQMETGAIAGHAEMVKMSRRLLSAPIIFLVLTHYDRGPALMRAVLAVGVLGGLDLGEASGWGEFAHTPPLIRPADEKAFFDLLIEDKESVAHWLQQLGLMRDCVREDLQRLSNERSASRDEGFEAFFTVYPVIWACLVAKFALMPSATRLAEQLHGGARHGLRDGVSIQSTDSKRAYLMDKEYANRAARRRIAKRDDALRALEKAPSKRKRGGASAKHCARKSEQQMAGEQLLESGKKYSQYTIDTMPPEFLAEIGVKKLTKLGSSVLNKEMEVKQAAFEEEKHARRTREPVTLEAWQAKAASTKVGNDAEWVNPEEAQSRADFQLLASVKFWKKVTVKSGFFTLATAVLPHLSIDEDGEAEGSGEEEGEAAMEEEIATEDDNTVFTVLDKSESEPYSKNKHGLDLLQCGYCEGWFTLTAVGFSSGEEGRKEAKRLREFACGSEPVIPAL